MFGFPKTEKRVGFKFDKTYLNTVVFQINFKQDDKIGSESVRKKIKESLEELFKNKKDIYTQSFKVTVGEDMQDLSPMNEEEIIGVELRNDSNTEVVSITRDRITYTILGADYSCFQDYKDKMDLIFVQTLKSLEIQNISRIAIRKINVFELFPKEGTEIDRLKMLQLIYNNVLVDGLTYIPSANQMKAYISTTSFAIEEYELNIKYGLLPPSGNPTSAQLLLDIDLFRASNVSSKEMFEQFELINSEIYNIFRWSLQEGVIDYLFTVK